MRLVKTLLCTVSSDDEKQFISLQTKIRVLLETNLTSVMIGTGDVAVG